MFLTRSFLSDKQKCRQYGTWEKKSLLSFRVVSWKHILKLILPQGKLYRELIKLINPHGRLEEY